MKMNNTQKKLFALFTALSVIVSGASAFAEVSLPGSAGMTIIVPSGTELYVGEKPKEKRADKNYVPFTEQTPREVTGNEYHFELTEGNTYNYRVTSDDYVTYTGKFKYAEAQSLEITEEMLASGGKTKTTVDKNVTSNSGWNVADIYLNINPQGYLKLNEVGDTYQLVNLRTWQATDTVTANYFIEPDYHYEVIDENGNADDSVVTVSDSGVVEAVGEGVAIVLVTYDALNYANGGGGPFFGAIWQENTGVFVVGVGLADSGIDTNMTINDGRNRPGVKLAGDKIDAEHDVIYFTGDTGTYSFKPTTADCFVSVANPKVGSKMTFSGFETVEQNPDLSYDIPLKTGRNIVKLEKDGAVEYQIITAKKVSITINGGEKVHPGDELNIVFDTLYHPANKLASLYNMSAAPIYKSEVFEGKVIGGVSSQYNFASYTESQNIGHILKAVDQWGSVSYSKDSILTVPTDYEYDALTLTDGVLYVSGWGDSYGHHRNITLTEGRVPNNDAGAKDGVLGRLPDIEIPIVKTDSELDSISLTTDDVKTTYVTGSSFDTTNLVVTANYTDGTTQLATNYTVTPQILTENDTKVTITYKGKTADIDVLVATHLVDSLEIATPPTKTSYKAGEMFDPTGMVVRAVYTDLLKADLVKYTYAPNRELEVDDTEVTITFDGKSVTTPITVSENTGGGSTENKNVTVKFTLYGDSRHGTDGTTHTMAAGNLEKWIANKSVTVPKDSCVIDVIAKGLATVGMPYSNPSGNYIESINGLAEGSNGPLSGWMYMLNGHYPNLGLGENTVKSGDVIVMHYTDDYTKEKASESFGGGSTTVKTDTAKKNDTKADETDYESVIKQTSAGLVKSVPNPALSQTGGGWLILGLARGEYNAPSGYYDGYYENVCKTLKEKNGVLHDTKYTEYARVTLALTAIGKNPAACGGYDLTAPLSDYGKVTAQGLNGPVFALIALDSNGYSDEDIRSRYVSYILSMQNNDGGFKLTKSSGSDVDITAMSLIALSRYSENKAVKSAIDKALAYISKNQNSNGTFGTVASAETNAQVLTAMTMLGIDINDSRFVKKNKTVLDGLMLFNVNSAGFSHTLSTDKVNAMATEQALYALVAYDRSVKGKNTLYDMTDVKSSISTSSTEFGLVGKHEDVKLMPIIKDGAMFGDISDSAYKTAIEELAARGIVDGKDEGEFEPTATMTRAEFAAITVRALGLDVNGEKIFDDVSENDWYYGCVATAFKYGIINGVTDSEFNPNGTITRAETAVMLERVAKLCGNVTDINENKVKDVLAQFDDYMNIVEWSANSVAWCVDNAVMPSDELEIKANEHIKREESAYMLYRVMELSKLV